MHPCSFRVRIDRFRGAAFRDVEEAQQRRCCSSPRVQPVSDTVRKASERSTICMQMVLFKQCRMVL